MGMERSLLVHNREEKVHDVAGGLPSADRWRRCRLWIRMFDRSGEIVKLSMNAPKTTTWRRPVMATAAQTIVHTSD
jgi:hypothetical protein